MPADLQDYATHFQPGIRVRIGVPLASGATFQEWAKVLSLRGDLLEAELSRDSLPPQARMEPGGLVQVGLLDRQRGLGCRGEIVICQERHRLVLRLLDELAGFEPREFFRLDLTLPLELRIPASQFSRDIREHWRQSRWAIEFAGQAPESGESVELIMLREELQARLERRKAAPAVAANVSGNGMRLKLHERLRPGMLVELGIFLPQPEKVLEVVGEVVQVTASATKEDGFSTALCYRFIDEADRDRLVGYIASQQLWQLSRQPPKGGAPTKAPPKLGPGPLPIALGLLIIAGVVAWQAYAIVASRERGEKHEIARIFEAGIVDLIRRHH